MEQINLGMVLKEEVKRIIADEAGGKSGAKKERSEDADIRVWFREERFYLC